MIKGKTKIYAVINKATGDCDSLLHFGFTPGPDKKDPSPLLDDTHHAVELIADTLEGKHPKQFIEEHSAVLKDGKFISWKKRKDEPVCAVKKQPSDDLTEGAEVEITGEPGEAFRVKFNRDVSTPGFTGKGTFDQDGKAIVRVKVLGQRKLTMSVYPDGHSNFKALKGYVIPIQAAKVTKEGE